VAAVTDAAAAAVTAAAAAALPTAAAAAVAAAAEVTAAVTINSRAAVTATGVAAVAASAVCKESLSAATAVVRTAAWMQSFCLLVSVEHYVPCSRLLIVPLINNPVKISVGRKAAGFVCCARQSWWRRWPPCL